MPVSMQIKLNSHQLGFQRSQSKTPLLAETPVLLNLHGVSWHRFPHTGSRLLEGVYKRVTSLGNPPHYTMLVTPLSFIPSAL